MTNAIGCWLGWIPVIPVNMILIAGHLKATLLPNVSPVELAICLTVLLYADSENLNPCDRLDL